MSIYNEYVPTSDILFSRDSAICSMSCNCFFNCATSAEETPFLSFSALLSSVDFKDSALLDPTFDSPDEDDPITVFS